MRMQRKRFMNLMQPGLLMLLLIVLLLGLPIGYPAGPGIEALHETTPLTDAGSDKSLLPAEAGKALTNGPTQMKMAEALGKLPLSFEPNRGRTDARVKFLARGDGYGLFLTAEGAILTLASEGADTGRSDGT